LTIIAPYNKGEVMQVLLVDAFPMVRAALTGLIEQHFGGAQVLGVDSVTAARDALAQGQPRLVLLDLRMDGGFELLQQIHREHLLLPVVAISGSDDTEEALRALGAGAMGYVPERSDLDTLVQALHLVLAGGTYVPLLKPRADDTPPVAAAAAPMPADWAELPLTPRQKHVLHLLTQGLSNKLIARELGVSVDTVKDHVTAVLKALGVNSRTRAVVVATQKSR
jgi:DNA-binding NarL/FixJ family response regulator